MRQKSKPKRRSPKSVLRRQILTIQSPPFFKVWDQPPHNGPIALPLMISSVGIARNLAWRLAGSSSCGIAMNWNPANSPPRPSTCGWQLSDGSHMKHLTMDC